MSSASFWSIIMSAESLRLRWAATSYLMWLHQGAECPRTPLSRRARCLLFQSNWDNYVKEFQQDLVSLKQLGRDSENLSKDQIVKGVNHSSWSHQKTKRLRLRWAAPNHFWSTTTSAESLRLRWAAIGHSVWLYQEEECLKNSVEKKRQDTSIFGQSEAITSINLYKIRWSKEVTSRFDKSLQDISQGHSLRNRPAKAEAYSKTYIGESYLRNPRNQSLRDS